MNIFKNDYFYGNKKPLLEVKSENLDYKKYEITKIDGNEFIVGIDKYGYDFNKKSKNTIAFLAEILSIVALNDKPDHILDWNEAERLIDRKRLCKLFDKYGWIVDIEKQHNYTREEFKYEKGIKIIYTTSIHGVSIKDIYKRIVILSLLDRLIPSIKRKKISDAEEYSALLFQYFDNDNHEEERDIDDVIDQDYKLHLILKENCEQYTACKKLYDKFSLELREVIDECMVVYNEMVVYNGRAFYKSEIVKDGNNYFGCKYVRFNLTDKDILDNKIMELLETSHPHLNNSEKEKIYLYFSNYYKYYALITDVQGFEDFYSRYKQLNDKDKIEMLEPYIEKIINDELINVKSKYSMSGNIYYQCDDAISNAYFNFTELLSNQAIGHTNVRTCPTCKSGIIIGNTSKKTCNFCNRKTLHQKKKKDIKQRYKDGETFDELKDAFNEGIFKTAPASIEKWINEIKNE
jgi:hypothetical protein